MIPERDVYHLVMRSRLPAAEAFEKWVAGTILPTIRKDGMNVRGEEKGNAQCVTPGRPPPAGGIRVGSLVAAVRIGKGNFAA
jgi:hypothetical protein